MEIEEEEDEYLTLGGESPTITPPPLNLMPRMLSFSPEGEESADTLNMIANEPMQWPDEIYVSTGETPPPVPIPIKLAHRLKTLLATYKNDTELRITFSNVSTHSLQTSDQARQYTFNTYGYSNVPPNGRAVEFVRLKDFHATKSDKSLIEFQKREKKNFVVVDIIFDSATIQKWRIMFRIPVSLKVLERALEEGSSAIGSAIILPAQEDLEYQAIVQEYRKLFVVEQDPPIRS